MNSISNIKTTIDNNRKEAKELDARIDIIEAYHTQTQVSIAKINKDIEYIRLSVDKLLNKNNNLLNLSNVNISNVNDSINNNFYKTIHENLIDPFLKGEYGNIIKWKALKVLSEGNISTIYKAIDINEGKIIAIKRFNFLNFCDSKDN